MVHSRKPERKLGKKGVTRIARGTSRGHKGAKGVAQQHLKSIGSGNALEANHTVGNMEPQEISAGHSSPSNIKGSTVRVAGAPWGLQLGPRRAVVYCDRCHNHGITTKIKGQEHNCLFKACQCPNCVFFSGPRKASPSMTLKREQGKEIKEQVALGLIKSMTAAPKPPHHVKNLAVGAQVNTGNVNIMPQTQAFPCYISNPGRSTGVILLTQSSEPTILTCAPVTTEPPLVLAISGQPQGSTLLPATCTSLILQPCANPDPHLLQPQAPKDCDADEWQRKLEAAEALLALRYSCPAPPDPIPPAQPCNQSAPSDSIPQAQPCNQSAPPDPIPPAQPCNQSGSLKENSKDGLDRPFQPLGASRCPRPATSISLSIGHIGCISLLS